MTLRLVGKKVGQGMSLTGVLEGNSHICNEGEGKTSNNCATKAFGLLRAEGYEQSGCSEHQK